MKSRISFSNRPALKKDITRFAPVWILYSVFLLLLFTLCVGSDEQWIARTFGETASFLAVLNFCYALLTAQLLFGDLFSPRMTNALHAMPLRRETWFATHVTAGILFSLVPNLGITVAMLPFCGSVPLIPWMWLLTAMLQYLFFFGLAVLCAMCVGSRFAMVMVYGLVNFGSLLAWWLLDTVYVPLLSGVVLQEEIFLKLCPVVWGTMHIPYEMDFGKLYQTVAVVPEDLGYLGILAGIGVVFGVLALWLYRKRHLETACDFIAAPRLKPVFLVVYTLMMGVGFQWVLGWVTGWDWIYLVIGILVGWFTGQMLVMRTTKVFTKRAVLGLGALVLVLVLSLGLTVLDPLGIQSYVPDPSRVASVSLNYEETEDPELIAAVIRAHQAALDDSEEESLNGGSYYMNLTYTMTDGSQVSRKYTVPYQGTAHESLRMVLSSPEFVLGDLPEWWANPKADIQLYDSLTGDYISMGKSSWQELLAAVLLDCEAGTMAQHASYHGGWNAADQRHTLEFQCYDTEQRYYRYFTIIIYEDCENTLAWLKQQRFYQVYVDPEK